MLADEPGTHKNAASSVPALYRRRAAARPSLYRVLARSCASEKRLTEASANEHQSRTGENGSFTDRTTHDRTAGKRRRALRWRRLALAATVAAVAAWLVTGARSDSRRVSREFAFTGASAQYVVPLGVCRIRVEAAGGSGGLQGAAGTPGLGARVTATLRVSPDETLLVYVGGQGGTAVGATPGAAAGTGAATEALPSAAPTDAEAVRAPEAAAPQTSGVARGGSRTASWSPAGAPAAAAAGSAAPTAQAAARAGAPQGTTDTRRSDPPIP